MPTIERVSLESQLKELQQLEEAVVGPISSSLNQYLQAKALHEQLNEKCVITEKEICSSIVRIDTSINQVVFVSSISKSPKRTNLFSGIVFANQYSEKLSLSQQKQLGRSSGRYVNYSSLEEVEFINKYFIQRTIEKLQGKKITKPVTWYHDQNTTLQKRFSLSTFKRRIHYITKKGNI